LASGRSAPSFVNWRGRHVQQCSLGLVEIHVMGEITAGRLIFGPDDARPVLGTTALDSVGIVVDPANRSPRTLPAIPLKIVTALANR
jgi:hypothetical protein